jgi:uncharacterized protein (DUF1778 family)
MKQKKTHDMHVRLDFHEWERIVYAAALEKRSVSNFVRNIVISYIDNFSNYLEDKR